MDIFQAIILGIIEGVTEYIPVSSTGHLILAQKWMGLHGGEDDAFAIVIQGGAILAVLGLYRKRVVSMIQGLFGKDSAGLKLALNLIIAFLPAAILGFFLHSTIKAMLFKPIPIVTALAAGGILMIFVSRWQKSAYEDNEDNTFVDIGSLTWKAALFIGLLQCVAMWPGVSRSMITIVAAMIVGMRPKHAAEFSFLLGLPTLGGATLFEAYQSSEELRDINIYAAIVGIITAFIAAAIAIKWLVAYLSTHGLALFGWYRIAIALLVTLGLWNGYLSIDGNNASNTAEGTTETSSTSSPLTLDTFHCFAFPVATQTSPLTTTGPTAACQCPEIISCSPRISVHCNP